MFNLTLSFASRVTDVVLILKYATPKHPEDLNYENVFYQTTVNMCKVLAEKTANIFIKMLIDDIKNYSTTEMKCPLKKVP